MSNVLDLKDHQPGDAVPEQLVAEVAPLAIAQTTSIDEMGEMQSEGLPPATLAGFHFPTATEWTAHHPLQGSARKRHMLFSGLIVLLGVLISLWQRSPAAFIVLLIGAGVLELREHMSKPMTVGVDDRGIKIDDHRYDHASFSSFHIHRMPDDTLELSLRSDQRFLPHLRLPLGQQDPHQLHAILTQYIPQGDHKIPLVDYLIRKPRE